MPALHALQKDLQGPHDRARDHHDHDDEHQARHGVRDAVGNRVQHVQEELEQGFRPRPRVGEAPERERQPGVAQEQPDRPSRHAHRVARDAAQLLRVDGREAADLDALGGAARERVGAAAEPAARQDQQPHQRDQQQRGDEHGHGRVCDRLGVARFGALREHLGQPFGSTVGGRIQRFAGGGIDVTRRDEEHPLSVQLDRAGIADRDDGHRRAETFVEHPLQTALRGLRPLLRRVAAQGGAKHEDLAVVHHERGAFGERRRRLRCRRRGRLGLGAAVLHTACEQGQQQGEQCKRSASVQRARRSPRDWTRVPAGRSSCQARPRPRTPVR